MPPVTRAYARVALRKKLARAVGAGHPWIFRDALRLDATGGHRDGLADGDVVLVTTPDGRPLGRGFWAASSPIAVRMMTTDPTEQDLPALVRARVVGALERRLALLDRQQTNTFRWLHGEADLLPGVNLDVYGIAASVRFDGPGARAFYRDLPPAILAAGASLGLRTLVERGARGRDGGEGDASPGARAKLLGGDPPPPAGELEVLENGLRFGVDLLHGQKGGMFLDQRDNRQRVRGWAAGRRVLNLFGYTGGFSIYAAAGGALETTTVDSSSGAIASAQRNFRRNGLPEENARFVTDDVFAFLGRAAKSKTRWDLVVSDPPSFAPNRRALPQAVAAYRRLHRLCAAVVEPGGMFCAASCSSHLAPDAFLASIEAGCDDAGRSFQVREQHGAGADHPVLPAFPEGRYLKFVMGHVA